MHVQDMRASNSLILFLQPPQTRPLVIGSRQARGLIHGRNTNPLTQRLPSPPPLPPPHPCSLQKPLLVVPNRYTHFYADCSTLMVPNRYTMDRIHFHAHLSAFLWCRTITHLTAYNMLSRLPAQRRSMMWTQTNKGCQADLLDGPGLCPTANHVTPRRTNSQPHRSAPGEQPITLPHAVSTASHVAPSRANNPNINPSTRFLANAHEKKNARATKTASRTRKYKNMLHLFKRCSPFTARPSLLWNLFVHPAPPKKNYSRS